MIKVRPDAMAGLIKSREELEIMREAGRKLAVVRQALVEAVKPGVTTLELDEIAQKGVESQGAEPAFLGYRGFPGTVCASVDEEIVHGIPSARRRLKEGQIVSLDVGLKYEGFFSDTAVTVAVGKVSPELERLIDVTRRSLDIAIEAMSTAKRLGDISAAIQNFVEGEAKLAVVRDYTGHGIGRALHEEPQVLNYGKPGKGRRLRPGMVLALEPMVNLGTSGTRVLEDDWTVVTADGQPSAHFEHTVALTENGAEILTALD